MVYFELWPTLCKTRGGKSYKGATPDIQAAEVVLLIAAHAKLVMRCGWLSRGFFQKMEVPQDGQRHAAGATPVSRTIMYPEGVPHLMPRSFGQQHEALDNN